MSISEIVKILRCDRIAVNFDGCKNDLHPEDQLQMAAYGDFIVERANIYSIADETVCEIAVKTSFARKGV